jgi:hypothetical protein
MSGKTISEKRIDAELIKATAKCAKTYQGYFPDAPADDEFWRETMLADDKLATELETRPLSSMQVRKAVHGYTTAFKRACEAGRLRGTRGSDPTHREGSS